MPTFTTIALENLLEPVKDTYKSPLSFEKSRTKSPPYYANNNDSHSQQPAKHHFISPALYITPELAPIPEDSAAPLSPSPYVVNHKRRGGEHLAIWKTNGFQVPDETELKYQGENEQDEEEESVKDEIRWDTEVNGDGIEEFEGASEEFFDPAFDLWSVGSAGEVRGFGCRSNTSAWEFFDADEELFPEGHASNISLHGANIDESELHTLRLELLEETKKRKAAEDALTVMGSQWLKIRDVLYQEGLTLPSPSDVISGMELEHGSIQQLLQELAVARFVAEAMGKGQARAEAELASEAILETKNQEISRLKDRLQYYEAVNHEMSLRNQEIIDAARKQRQRKRTLQKWLWSFVGFSAVIGVSMAAYTYLPQTSSHQPPSTDNTDSRSS